MKILLVKLLLLVPFLLFLDLVIMVITGSLSSICGAGYQFFSTIYFYFSIMLLSVTGLLIIYAIYNEGFQHSKQI